VRAPLSPRVAHPVMYHRWRWITFLHWRYAAATVQPLLPPELTVETFDGTAWVGLTPFLMDGVRVPGIPAVPGLSQFPETNVRTYARDGAGRSGIWFLSLDAALLPAVLAARAGYRLPYFWADMSVHRNGDRLTYRGRRRWPGPPGPHADADAELGRPLDDAERDELAHFLTARHRLFTVVAGRLAAAEVEHPPWPLRRARLERLDQDLLRAARLPDPRESPLVHASPGVPVRVGRWHR
jgi:uncharacterized protein YqjF (DUF2071 family)